MMDPKLVDDFCSNLSKADIYNYLIKYIINHSYFSCKGVSTDLLFKKFGIYYFNGEYSKYRNSIIWKLSRLTPDLVKGGIIEKYNANSYKVVRENGNGNGKVEFESTIRSVGIKSQVDSLYLTIPVKTTRQYNLVRDKRAMVNIEILN